MPNIKLFTVTWSTDTAGVSPDNNMRTELFFKGCNKALSGNACLGCFNRKLWDDSADITYSPESIAKQIKTYAPNHYVTIGGGEPTDQMEGLIELTKLLKAEGFHIMVYTWKDLQSKLNEETKERDDFIRLLKNIDMLVDGIYDPRERLYKGNAGDGFLSSIGSGNQTIWDVRYYNQSENNQLIGYKMRDLHALHLKMNDSLVYITKEDKEPISLLIKQKGVA